MTQNTKPISPLRRRMIEDMMLRKLSPQTQTAYIHAVKSFTRFLKRAPDSASGFREAFRWTREDGMQSVESILTTAGVDLTGTVQDQGGTPLCSLVLASEQFMFSCNPNGPFLLLDLPTENDGTVKRQVYVDGFFPNVETLPGSVDETVVMQRAGTCPSYNTPYNPGVFPSSAGKRINISGQVLLQNSQTPICATVLANGQLMFSCDGTGSYSLNIPLDNNGQFKLQVYAGGFAPTIQTFDEFQVINDVRMARAAECQATTGQTFPATGQTSCWDSVGNRIPCAGTGHDGDIKAGAELSYTETTYTVIDNNTQLEWMKQDWNQLGCESYPGNLDHSCLFTWDEAFAFVANLNANNHGGHDDWRVPNVKELQSIVNYENFAPAVSAEFHTGSFIGCVPGCTLDACSCTSNNPYWSSTSFEFVPDLAWNVDFFSGIVTTGGGTTGKASGKHVRAVRGGL